jgi:ferrous iron transport protein B
MTHAGRRWVLVDLPGIYSLAPRSPDEMIAVDVLLGHRRDVARPDVVLCVVDASNLERNLYLVGQVLELGRPTVIALTMMDVAHARGMRVDASLLRRRLGVPVVAIQPGRRMGLEALKSALSEAAERPAPTCRSPLPGPFQEEVAHLETLLPAAGSAGGEAVPRFLVERLLLDADGYFEGRVLTGGDPSLRDALRMARGRLAQAGCPVPAIETSSRYGWVARVVEGVVTRTDPSRVSIGDRIDVVLTHRLWGTLILAALMVLMFHAVFRWAEAPMKLIAAATRGLAGLIAAQLSEGALRSLLIEGVIGGMGSVLAFLPMIVILFFFLAILEDCGYLARAAYLMDRVMVRVGLSGTSFIPLLSSFGCAIPGVMATRVIENRRDRLITILVAPLMSCSARLPVYALLIAAFIPDRSYWGGWIGVRGLTLLALYLVGILVAAAVALVLRRGPWRGATSPFIMELPDYKWPCPRVILHRIVERAWDFLHGAGTTILAVSVVMWAALYYPRLSPGDRAPFVAEQERLRAGYDRAARAGDAGTMAEATAALRDLDDRIACAQRRQSFVGRAGRWIEPVVRPLGWDWRIGSAVLASLPARETVVATLGVVFDAGAGEPQGEGLHAALRSATWPGTDRPLFTTPVALSIMIFFALCGQCVATLAVIRRETNSWTWPACSFALMTILAYVGALMSYQIGMWLLA